VLVTTPLATRGLDFPAVTHVFNLGLVGSAADYLHRAGRAGRIGQVCQALRFFFFSKVNFPRLLGQLSAKS